MLWSSQPLIESQPFADKRWTWPSWEVTWYLRILMGLLKEPWWLSASRGLLGNHVAFLTTSKPWHADSSVRFCGLPPEVMNLLNKCVLSQEQVSSQLISHSLWKPVLLFLLWGVSCVCGHTHVQFLVGVGGGGRGRSIFMSRFVRFYFIFLISFPQSTYAFWCLRPHDFAFISD